MIEGQEVWNEPIHRLTVEGQPTKSVSAQTYVGVFSISSVSHTIPKPPADHVAKFRGLQFEKHCRTGLP
jgi:hypothetical protein